MYEVRYQFSIWDVLDLIEIMYVKESNSNIIKDQIDSKNKSYRGG